MERKIVYCSKCGNIDLNSDLYYEYEEHECEYCGTEFTVMDKTENDYIDKTIYNCSTEKSQKMYLIKQQEVEQEIFNNFIKDGPNFSQIAMERRIKEHEIDMNNFDKQYEERNRQYIPCCPTCSSTNVSKITTGQKVVGGALFGLFSSNVRKSYQCHNCGYKW